MSKNDITDLGHIETPDVPPLNDLALVSFITGIGGWGLLVLGLCSLGSPFGFACGAIALFSWMVALPTGYFAQREIAERGENGHDLARTGLIAAIVGIILVMLLLLLLVLGLLGLIGAGIFSELSA